MFLPIFLVFLTIMFLAYAVFPIVFQRTATIAERRQSKYSYQLERIMPKSQVKRLTNVYLIAPIVLPAVLFFVFPEQIRLVGVILGLIIGFIIPNSYTRYVITNTRNKFQDQLVDALMIMSSSFRGGLSLIQAMEAVVEEMPDPINQEFGIVLGENKMGVSLEEALTHLFNRMPSSSLQQMNTAVLLARETGGNLPVIFNRIVNSIREHRKIRENIKTLTMQGKIQGFVMTILPVIFGMFVYQTNRRLFENMLATDTGRFILVYALISLLIGGFLIWRISTVREY